MITRKAYGGAYDVMGSKHLGADINLAWPTAQIAVMGAQGAVNILYRKELRGRRRRRTSRPRAELITEYEDTLANPYIAAERGYIDAVITPSETRAQRRPRRCGRCAPSARPCRPRSTGTSRCDVRPESRHDRRRDRWLRHRAAARVAIVVHGDATPEQLAALVAVLSAASGGDEPASAAADVHLGRRGRGGDAPPGEPRPRRLAHLPALLTGLRRGLRLARLVDHGAITSPDHACSPGGEVGRWRPRRGADARAAAGEALLEPPVVLRIEDACRQHPLGLTVVAGEGPEDLGTVMPCPGRPSTSTASPALTTPGSTTAR